MLVELLEWIEAQDDGGDEAKLEISKFATDLLNRRVKKVRKDGRILQDMSPMDRHKLRIRVKKIRYAMEFSAVGLASESTFTLYDSTQPENNAVKTNAPKM